MTEEMSEAELFKLWCEEGRDPEMFPIPVPVTQEDIEWAKNTNG